MVLIPGRIAPPPGKPEIFRGGPSMIYIFEAPSADQFSLNIDLGLLHRTQVLTKIFR